MYFRLLALYLQIVQVSTIKKEQFFLFGTDMLWEMKHHVSKMNFTLISTRRQIFWRPRRPSGRFHDEHNLTVENMILASCLAAIMFVGYIDCSISQKRLNLR